MSITKREIRSHAHQLLAGQPYTRLVAVGVPAPLVARWAHAAARVQLLHALYASGKTGDAVPYLLASRREARARRALGRVLGWEPAAEAPINHEGATQALTACLTGRSREPKPLGDHCWDLGERWAVSLYGGVVLLTYDHRVSFEWDKGPALLRDAVAKALMGPIDPFPLGEGWELEGRESGITLHTPHCRFDIPEAPARALLAVLWQLHDQRRISEARAQRETPMAPLGPGGEG